jgi:hypothetical protein
VVYEYELAEELAEDSTLRFVAIVECRIPIEVA